MFKLNKKILLAVVVLSIFTMSIAGCSKDDAKKDDDSNSAVVAVVDGDEITQTEFDRDFKMFENMYMQQYGEDALSQEVEGGATLGDLLKENILEKLIIERIVAKDVEDLGIEVADEEVDAQLQMNIDSVGGEEAFQEFLEENDFTDELYRENLIKEMSYQKHEEEFMAEAEISEPQMMEYFESNKDDLEEVKVSHILVESEEEGMEIIDNLEDGEDFAALAETESIDSNSAVEGGSLGSFNREQQVISPEFMNVAFGLEAGQFSKLVETEMGHHIILLEEKMDSYEDVKDHIAMILKSDRYVQRIEDLKADADIEILMEKDEVEEATENK